MSLCQRAGCIGLHQMSFSAGISLDKRVLITFFCNNRKLLWIKVKYLVTVFLHKICNCMNKLPTWYWYWDLILHRSPSSHDTAILYYWAPKLRGWTLACASSDSYEAPLHLSQLLLMQHHRTAQHALRRTLSALSVILTNTHPDQQERGAILDSNPQIGRHHPGAPIILSYKDNLG